MPGGWGRLPSLEEGEEAQSGLGPWGCAAWERGLSVKRSIFRDTRII